MILFAIVSGKGGAGKTTLAMNIGYLLASMGKTIILVDGDPEFACLSRSFRLSNAENHILRIISADIPVWKGIYPSRVHRLMGVVPMPLNAGGNEPILFDIFVSKLREVSGKIDYVILDGSQGIGANVRNAIAAFKRYIIVVEPDVWGLDAALLVKGVGDQVGAKPLGFVINNVEIKNVFTSSRIASIERLLETRCLGVIPHDPVIKACSLKLEVYASRNRDSPAYIEMKRIALTLLGKRAPSMAVRHVKRSWFSRLFGG
ncbi:MAG: AAA family ATPase [Candidatus Baldrarchaeia archaeon]